MKTNRKYMLDEGYIGSLEERRKELKKYINTETYRLGAQITDLMWWLFRLSTNIFAQVELAYPEDGVTLVIRRTGLKPEYETAQDKIRKDKQVHFKPLVHFT